MTASLDYAALCRCDDGQLMELVGEVIHPRRLYVSTVRLKSGRWQARIVSGDFDPGTGLKIMPEPSLHLTGCGVTLRSALVDLISLMVARGHAVRRPKMKDLM